MKIDEDAIMKCKCTNNIQKLLIECKLEVEIPVWHYITNLESMQNDIVNSDDVDVLALQQALYQCVSGELELLGSHVCPACNGWGHSREKCPTWAKLGHLASVGTHGA